MARRILLAAATCAAAAATFLPAADFQFLNWDDNVAIVANSALALPGAARWAFSTTLLEHYQPVSWIVWAAIRARAGIDPRAFHTANIAAHAVCVLLVWFVARRLLALSLPRATSAALDGGATVAALLYGVHPLRVEVVAWISALPYSLAIALLLAATLVWLRPSASPRTPKAAIVALVLYAASLAARPLALGFPIVVAMLEVWPYRRTIRASIGAAAPFAVLAAIAAVGELVARAPGADAAPGLYRVQSAASAPFLYLWHSAVPAALTPLDVLPLQPEGRPSAAAAAVAALIVASLAAWRYRRRYPAAGAAWVCYLALLAPAAGLVPSGLQATADRYAYLPGIVVSILAAGVLVHWCAQDRTYRRPAIAAAGVCAAALACVMVTRAAMRPWGNSVSLWTRVVSLDPGNDVGLYNLALALAADGRADEAAARYRDVLAIAPQHPDARANLDRLDAVRLEREGNELAGRGELAEAADRYAQALARDPMRTHSHAARGVALATLGDPANAVPELQAAIRQGDHDPAVANALGVLLLQSGRTEEARAVFETAFSEHPSDRSVMHNLARLLATATPRSKGDAERALQLANAVVGATGGRDPRALETLATALAANGRLAEADVINARAAALAIAAGDRELAVQITARRRAYRSPGQ